MNLIIKKNSNGDLTETPGNTRPAGHAAVKAAPTSVGRAVQRGEPPTLPVGLPERGGATPQRRCCFSFCLLQSETRALRFRTATELLRKPLPGHTRAQVRRPRGTGSTPPPHQGLRMLKPLPQHGVESGARFGGTHAKIGTVQRRLSGPCARMAREFVKCSVFFVKERIN